jgi:hypothetical protein
LSKICLEQFFAECSPHLQENAACRRPLILKHPGFSFADLIWRAIIFIRLHSQARLPSSVPVASGFRLLSGHSAIVEDVSLLMLESIFRLVNL